MKVVNDADKRTSALSSAAPRKGGEASSVARGVPREVLKRQRHIEIPDLRRTHGKSRVAGERRTARVQGATRAGGGVAAEGLSEDTRRDRARKR